MADRGADRDIAADRSPAFRGSRVCLAWLMLAPLLAWLILFVIVPTIMLVVLSLGEQKGAGIDPFHFHV